MKYALYTPETETEAQLVNAAIDSMDGVIRGLTKKNFNDFLANFMIDWSYQYQVVGSRDTAVREEVYRQAEKMVALNELVKVALASNVPELQAKACIVATNFNLSV